MINIVRTKLENKIDKPIIFYMAGSRIVLNPGIPVILDGDLFSQETRQEGNTEGLLINIYNGNIDLTLICDKTFINKIEQDDVVVLPKRAQARMISKKATIDTPEKKAVSEVKPVEAPKVEKTVEAPKEAPKVAEEKQVETSKEEPKADNVLENVIIEDTKAKSRSKKVTKL